MAQDPKAVQERLKELRADQLSFVSKELLEIPSQLNDTEDILALTSGIYGRNNKNWLIVATSERLLLLYKKKDLLAESYLPDSIGDCSCLLYTSPRCCWLVWQGRSWSSASGRG